MIIRIISVITMVLSAMWITNEPSYEPIIVFITSLIGWVGSEYDEHRNMKWSRYCSKYFVSFISCLSWV